jgi:hypothetical protein
VSLALDLPISLMLGLLVALTPVDGRRDHGPGSGSAPAALLAPALVAAAVATAPAFSRVVANDEHWLGAVKQAGAAAGFEAEARRIFTTSSGRHYVPIAEERRQIFDLRRNPRHLVVIVEAAAKADQAALAQRLKGEIGFDDLIVAHTIGVEAAARLIALERRDPKAVVSAALADIAVAYPELAFSTRRARSAAEMTAEIRRPFGAAVASLAARATAPAAVGATTPPAKAPSVAGWAARVIPEARSAGPANRVQRIQ